MGTFDGPGRERKGQRREGTTIAVSGGARPRSVLAREASAVGGCAIAVIAVPSSLGTSRELFESGLQTSCATDGAREGEARQFDLGEGPSYTAHRTGWPVQVVDLERDDRWPACSDAAAVLGLRAAFAFPLRSGSVTLGALTLYRHVPGELTPAQYAVALAVARFARNLLTSLQAGRPPDDLGRGFTESLSSSVGTLQASGVVSVQLGISVGAALAVLRAHAFAEMCSLAEVSAQVIDHRLMLGPLQD